MSDWPVFLRFLLTGIVFVLTIWAFSSGQMLLAIVGVAACGFVFRRFFLSDL